MDSFTSGFFVFTWIFILWMGWFGFQMIKSIVELNDKILAHVGLKNETLLDESQTALTDFLEEE